MNKAGNARFELGYTIVCNRSQSDLGITNDERNAREAMFFKSEPWNAIPEERAGVKSLKDRLKNFWSTSRGTTSKLWLRIYGL